MKAEKSIGLVCGGRLCRSYVAHLSSLQMHLGPIKAASFPVARRFARAFGAGYPVQPFSALELCSTIFVLMPEAQLDDTIAAIVRHISVTGTEFVICGTERDSLSFPDLIGRGAHLATLGPTEDREISRPWIAEGDSEIVRMLRTWFLRDRHQLLELQQGAKAFFTAGKNMVDELLLPLVSASMDCFREAGLSTRDAAQIVESLGGHSLTVPGKGGVRGGVDRMDRLQRLLAAIAPILAAENPRLAAMYVNAVENALEYYSGDGSSKGPGKAGSKRASLAATAGRVR